MRSRWPKRLLYAFALAIAGSTAFDIYARIPSRLDVTPLNLDLKTRSVVLLFHGRGGRDEPTLAALEQSLRALASGQAATAVALYIWSPYSDNRFRTAVNGAGVGEALGVELAALRRLEFIHLIGHSAGAYPLDPLCESYRKAGGRAHIAITYLDPIGIQGVFDFGWGARNYGACADYAEAFINTDDPVPATNTALAQAWNVDVTAAGKLANYTSSGHLWPVQYYLGQVSAGDVTAQAYTHRDRPRSAMMDAGAGNNATREKAP